MTETEKQMQEVLRMVEDRIDELKQVKQSLIKCQKDYECAAIERDMLRKQNERLMVSLKDCANENCQKCGKYINDHLGSCDGCKWKDVKNWVV